MAKIHKILTTGIIGATLAIGFTGCGQQNLQPKTLKLKPDKKVYKFTKKNPLDNSVNIKMLVEKAITNKRNLYKITRSYTTVKEKTDINIDKKANQINVDINLDASLCNSHIKFSKKFDIKETEDSITLSITNPNKIYFSKDAYYENLVGDKLCMLNINEADAIKAINYLPNYITVYKKQYELKGEVDTKYSAKSVYANFKRLLGEYSDNRYNNRYGSKNNINSTKIKNKFALPFLKKTLPLYVDVYPYRDGSKVVYTVSIPNDITSDGKIHLTKDDIKNIKHKIESIVKD